jgi:hypothetical protein
VTPVAATVPRADVEPVSIPEPPARAPVATRPFEGGTLALYPGPEDAGELWFAPGDERAPRPVACDRLTGAWGLWTDDVDGDGYTEVLVALHKPAKHDPQPANRLHVYGIEQGRCVPAWRGTRLAGRFEALGVDPAAPGTIVVAERVGSTRRRVTRYRWHGFGYRVAEVLWQGDSSPPETYLRDLVAGPRHPS